MTTPPRHSARQPTTDAMREVTLYDRWLLLAALGIISMGILMVASTSIAISEKLFHTPFHYLVRQAIFLSGGIVCMIALSRIPMRFWQAVSPFCIVLAFFCLLAVLIPGLGREVNGSTRWLSLGFVRIQVSEFVKALIVMYMAGYIVRHEKAVRESFKGFLRPMILLGIIAVLLLKQPDFGAVVVMTATVLAMLFMAGARLSQYLAMIVLIAIAFAILAVTSPYRLARLTTFLDPWAKQYDAGYQLTQSLIAFGRGGWFGVGLGESIQKLFYLPEAHTDFLFAVLAEELGLFGVLSVLLLFCALIWRGLTIARQALLQDHRFSGYLAYGIVVWLAMQVIVNIGVNTGVLPTKGLTLPLMSYGGSSMLVSCCLLGWLLRIDHELRREQFGFSKTTRQKIRQQW